MLKDQYLVLLIGNLPFSNLHTGNLNELSYNIYNSISYIKGQYCYA